MKRLVGSLVGLAVMVLLMFVPALFYSASSSSDAGSETAKIDNYQASFTVDKDGTLHGKETLLVDFPIYKHGIFRFFDTSDAADSHVRLVPQHIKVTQDGKDAGVDLTKESGGRYVVAKIGDAERTIVGQHTYVISYDVPGALAPAPNGGSGSQFYWNLIPSGWQMPIAKSSLTATLPVAPTKPRCAVGAGSSSGCDASVSGDTISVTTGSLAPQTPVTVQTALALRPPGQKTVPWAPRLDPVLGRSPVVLLIFLVLAALGAVAGALFARTAREDDPAYPLMYAPPEGIGPAQGAYLLTERINDDMYAATMLELGEKGLATIERSGDGWKISGKQGDWSGVDTISAQCAAALGLSPGTSITAQGGDVATGKRMQEARNGFDGAVKQWSQSTGLMLAKGLPMLGAALVILGLVLALLLFFVNPLHMSVVGLPFGAFAVFGAALVAPGSTTVRTSKGRDVWSQVGGFRRVLGTSSSEARFDFSGRKDLYTKYIPWAVAFGVADVWAEKYKVETREDPPAPSYFLGGYFLGAAGGFGSASGFSNSFSSSMHSAISSYQATQSQSSGGGGGGFSGGGGGGGGGGGSW